MDFPVNSPTSIDYSGQLIDVLGQNHHTMAMPNKLAPPQFNLLLQPEFPMNALILASDALRIANQNSGRHLFAWSFASELGEPVRASNGMWLSPDCSFDSLPRADVCLLFEGNLPTQHNSPALLQHLRAAARFGAIVGGVDTGIFALAQAGLVGTQDHPSAVLHWEAMPTFQERFPNVETKDAIFYVDDKRAHSAGGVATLDLILDLIARFGGDALANEVANALVHRRRSSTSRQRSDDERDTVANAVASRIVEVMESNLDFPLQQKMLAKRTGLSERSLTRFCRRHFGTSPMRLYLRLRLQAARNFLFYEEFSIKDVALACGFSFPAVFSRAFRSQFGQTPSAFRAEFRAVQHAAIKPEIRRLIHMD